MHAPAMLRMIAMQKPTRALIVDDDKEICALLCS